MCRHVGYLGTPVALDELLLAPRHGLLEQTWAPRDMRCGGTVNVDGFGVGWYPQPSASPTRYRNAVPLWTDASFAALAGQIRTGGLVAAVRSASAGMPVTATACAPFTDGRWLFSLNGRVDGWPESLAKAAERLDVVDLMTLEAPVDSAVVWALVRQRLRRADDPVAAVCDTLDEVLTTAPGSRMNLLLTDGAMLVATTWTHSLSVLKKEHAVTVASEPFGDDPAWQSVPDRHLVVADARQVSMTALPERGPT
jgi:gamma-glutamyl hercynylcysteine S-oxide hydrolase